MADALRMCSLCLWKVVVAGEACDDLSKTNIRCIFKDGSRELEQGLNRLEKWAGRNFPEFRKFPVHGEEQSGHWHRLEAKQLESNSTGKDPQVLMGRLRASEQCTTAANINNQLLGKALRTSQEKWFFIIVWRLQDSIWSTVSQMGLLYTGGTQTYKREYSRCSRAWSTWSTKRGWKSWFGSVWKRKKVQGRILLLSLTT